MKILRLKTHNFRNLESLDYQPQPGLNLFIGANAQGKTNILESIYVLAHTNSFRTHNDRNLVNYHSRFFRLKAHYCLGERYLEAYLFYDSERGKEYKINNHKALQHHEDRLRVVLFTPDDLYLVKGSPDKRRGFMDSLLKNLYPQYSYYHNNYGKILKKRNLLLRSGTYEPSSFKIINELYVENAVQIILARIKLIHSLEENSLLHCRDMNEEGIVKIRYALSFPVISGKINLDIVRESMLNALREKYPEEVRRKTSLIGPHLDDMHIYLNDRIARDYASQGQLRTLAVSLKLAEIHTMRAITGFYPVF
ncbi:DNA replication/repair protein RecF [Syntrophomonas palmitatica]|uniref:DNA replication/repair protein RecF n=1 Tax=Syntrophomonas palmitatica TaxID=402877 RepID=UPI0006D066FE|nr:DNA replication and repair protein RecF [Syntrophomonas palmitatica]